MKTIFNIKDPRKSDTVITLIYYLIVGIVLFCIFKSGKFNGGSCGIGLDDFSFFLLGPITLYLIIRNILLAIWKKKKNTAALLIHIVAIIIWLLIFHNS